ncbi:hypothetical protein ACQKM9_03725 [Viridibacillus sp. NPDC093762]|uniref:hypothetical protein n=1 Tax=Viridibacillus sp. NPDC093762 TaxID=3390720 RepID=UPI003D0850EF
MTQYERYLSGLDLDGSKEDKATFSLLELKIDDEHFENFQQELNSLMLKYYNKKINIQNIPTRIVAVTIIPKS